MKIQDIVTIIGVAVATTALTLGFVVPEQVDAVDQEKIVTDRIAPLISQPTLETAGLDVKLAMDKPDYAPGDKPVVTLVAANPTDHRVETNLWIRMTSASLSSRISRAPMMPDVLWSENVPLALEPGETKQFQFATEKEMVGGNTVSVTMSNTNQNAVVAMLLNLNGGAGSVPNAESANTKEVPLRKAEAE